MVRPRWLPCDTQGLGSHGGDPYQCVFPDRNLQTELPKAQHSAEKHQSCQVQREGSTIITSFIQWVFLQDFPPPEKKKKTTIYLLEVTSVVCSNSLIISKAHNGMDLPRVTIMFIILELEQVSGKTGQDTPGSRPCWSLTRRFCTRQLWRVPLSKAS